MPTSRVAGAFPLICALLLSASAARGAARPTPDLIASARVDGVIDDATAELYLAYALVAPAELPPAFASDVPWRGTVPLLELRRAVAAMPLGPHRARLEQLLQGACGGPPGDLPSVLDSARFHIEYEAIGGGLQIDDYVAALETTWAREIDEFGHAAPPVLASNPPPGDRYHVRVEDLGNGLYGYVDNSGTHAGSVGDNPHTPWDDVDAQASCMVLNTDYGSLSADPLGALRATAAHEFHHSVQFGYGALNGANTPDSIFIEGLATWIEDEVFDSADDNYFFLWPRFDRCMGEYPSSPYPYWVVFRAMTEPYGTGADGLGEQIVHHFWELISRRAASGLAAFSAGLSSKGGNLADAFHDAAIALKFLRGCGGGYVHPYCLEEGPGYEAASGGNGPHATIGAVPGQTLGRLRDNLAMHWIDLPLTPGPYRIRLENGDSAGLLRGSVVCDTGVELRVTAMSEIADPGRTVSIGRYDPAGCVEVMAVLTNQELTADDPTGCTQRDYRLVLDDAVADSPILLFAVKDPTYTDVELTWTGSSAPYRVLRGTAPDSLPPLAPAASNLHTDAGAVGALPDYYYQVE